MKILSISRIYPNPFQPVLGIFVHRRLQAIAANGGDLQIIAPVPWMPPTSMIGDNFYKFTKIPLFEKNDGISVYHPRYITAAKFARFLTSNFMYLSLLPLIKKLHHEFSFDIIDAHFAYPTGWVAVKIGKKLGIPISVTLRGADLFDDINRFLVREKVIQTLIHADALIAVSEDLKNKAKMYLKDSSHLNCIPNGVDFSSFYSKDKNETRKKLGLPLEKKIILSIGTLVKRKGFHILFQALKILKENDHNNLMLIIIGSSSDEGNDETFLKSEIKKHGIESEVLMVGTKLQKELVDWYASCDLFCLCSSREGNPNVVLEALACHRPVLLCDTPGNQEIFLNYKCGLMVKRDGKSIADGILEIMRKNHIKYPFDEILKQRSWNDIGKRVVRVFEKTLNINHQPIITSL